MQLDPSAYECATHSIDLTADVQGELEEVHVASFGVNFAGLDRSDGGDEFSVVVNCPGGDAGEPHTLRFTGTYR
jgi:hypothetical protein